MEWQQLKTREDLERAYQLSGERPVLIYKHSNRCHICTMALGRIERAWEPADDQRLAPFFLDVIGSREVSDLVAVRTGVTHQSPQVLVIRDGKCVYSESHSGITYRDIIAATTD